MTQPINTVDFLSGGGEMGKLMRAMDWSKTPLGPVEEWPQSLRTSVSICLNSQFPINMAWGRDLIVLYNDAFIPILGSKHPHQALGIPNRECFREIWNVIGPMMQGVLQSGNATWSEDLLWPLERSGYLEECYFTFSYCPIRDESGGVGGVFIPVKETTEKAITERRLSALRELAAPGIERAGKESGVYGLDYGADDYLIKPFSARELIAPVQSQLAMARIRKENEARTAADLQAMTWIYEVGNRCVRAGNYVQECLEEIVKTAVAVTGADKGNLQLSDADGRLTIAAHSGFESAFLTFFANQATSCNEARRYGQRVVVEDVTQSPMFDGTPALNVLLEAGVRACQSTPLVSSTGHVMGMISTHFARPHRPDERQLRLMDLLALQAADYLERKQAERALSLRSRQQQLLYELASAVNRSDEAPGLYETALDAIIVSLNATRASILLFDEQGAMRFQAWRGLSEAYRAAVEGHSPWTPRHKNPAPILVPDVAASEIESGLRRTILQEGIEALAFIPLTYGNRVIGKFMVYFDKPHVMNDQDIELARGIANTLAVGIERSRSEKVVRESEYRFRELVERSPFGIYIVDSQSRITLMNEASQRGAFRNVRPVIGRDLAEAIRTLWPEPVAEEIICLFRHTLDTGEPYHSHDFMNPRADVQQTEGYEWELHRLTLPDGRYGVICYSFDSTKLRETEQALRGSESQLREFNNQLEKRVHERTQKLVTSQQRLRSLAMELNLAEQRERKRLAVELHDHLQQLLVLGKLKLGQGRRLADGIPACADLIKATDDILSDALQYTRTLVGELSPSVLREHGLPAGLKWLGDYMRQHDLNVTVHVSDMNMTIPEDQAVLVFQSVRELLMNCRKHASTKDAQVTIDTSDGLLHIEVRDQGRGFELAAAGAAADSNPSNVLSSKFGLFSIGERMKALGGSFEIESVPGAGTSAKLSLPLNMSNSAHLASTPARSQVESPRHQRGAVPSTTDENTPIRVLLVDDHAMVREGLRTVLEMYPDVQVIGEACDGAEALLVADKLQPEVVVMDINMPKMNGIEATAQLKARYPHMVVIGLSVNAGEEDQAVMKRAGATTLITKDTVVEQLYAMIVQLARQSGDVGVVHN